MKLYELTEEDKKNIRADKILLKPHPKKPFIMIIKFEDGTCRNIATSEYVKLLMEDFGLPYRE